MAGAAVISGGDYLLELSTGYDSSAFYLDDSTLNGTAVTSSRTVISVLEQHQQKDGTVAVPQALLHYGAPAVIDPRT